MAPSTPTTKLNNGHEMPLVGFGLWKVSNDTCADQVYNAIKHGYRLLDGAFDYTNEVESGQGLARAIKEGIVKREDMFVTSKLWNTFHDPDRVEPVCKQQLAEWGIDYFDLYLMHFPVAQPYVDPAKKRPIGFTKDDAGNVLQSKTTIQETWQAMEKLVDNGLVKSIGISNFQGSLIMDLLRYARIRPSVLQVEHHPYLVQPQLLELAKIENIAVTAYSSFGPVSYHELDMKKALDAPLLFENPVIKKVAEAHGKTPAQVLLRWSTQRGIAVIPKSNNPERLHQNLDVNSFDLTEEEINEISGLDRHLRFNNPVDYGRSLLIFA
ncbi:MAG: NAD(P)H-dependent D-xylose reductase (XR) [Watsoniomyces obsoletus]|nr:MAG: NAD(P)H-dependent D-xylose reductase (XR) [Watsoniomyces obsoletus]